VTEKPKTVSCKIGKKDLSGLAVWEGKILQDFQVGKDIRPDTLYNWRIGFCSPLPPETANYRISNYGHQGTIHVDHGKDLDLCDKEPGPGYVQQFSADQDGRCWKDFNQDLTVSKWEGGDGVVLTSFDRTVAGRAIRQMETIVVCNASMPPYSAAIFPPNEKVTVRPLGTNVSNHLYQVIIQSPCACDGNKCPASYYHHHGPFYFLFVLFCLCMTIYCAAGIFVNKIRSTEPISLGDAIPHQRFWATLGSTLVFVGLGLVALTRHGLLFIVAKIRGRSQYELVSAVEDEFEVEGGDQISLEGDDGDDLRM